MAVNLSKELCGGCDHRKVLHIQGQCRCMIGFVDGDDEERVEGPCKCPLVWEEGKPYDNVVEVMLIEYADMQPKELAKVILVWISMNELTDPTR